jgi:hypothetical protein
MPRELIGVSQSLQMSQRVDKKANKPIFAIKKIDPFSVSGFSFLQLSHLNTVFCRITTDGCFSSFGMAFHH